MVWFLLCPDKTVTTSLVEKQNRAQKGAGCRHGESWEGCCSRYRSQSIFFHRGPTTSSTYSGLFFSLLFFFFLLVVIIFSLPIATRGGEVGLVREYMLGRTIE